MRDTEIAIVKNWNVRYILLIIFGMATPSQAMSASGLGTMCKVPFGNDSLIFESNGKGADRLSISPTSYILRYDSRVYLSKTKRTKARVIDLTARANSGLAIPSDFEEIGLLPLIRKYAELAGKFSDDAKLEQGVTPADCEARIIARERFSLSEIPIAVSPPSY
jgi:hypothetical protein